MAQYNEGVPMKLVGIGADQEETRTCFDQKMQKEWGKTGGCKVETYLNPNEYRTCFDKAMMQKWDPKRPKCGRGGMGGKGGIESYKFQPSSHRTLAFDDPDNIYSYKVGYRS